MNTLKRFLHEYHVFTKHNFDATQSALVNGQTYFHKVLKENGVLITYSVRLCKKCGPILIEFHIEANISEEVYERLKETV